jgi:hypothetical protein
MIFQVFPFFRFRANEPPGQGFQACRGMEGLVVGKQANDAGYDRHGDSVRRCGDLPPGRGAASLVRRGLPLNARPQ